MSIPIEYIRTETRNTDFIYQELQNETLNVDRSFQRRLVWQLKDKIRLIETMLLGYTIPELYFAEMPLEPSKGKRKYSIVDGQQRIDAVYEFLTNKYALDEKFIDYKEASYKNKKFEDLSELDQTKIWDYLFSIRFISSKVTQEEIIVMFDRLNSTSYALSPQELRHARFNGLFHNLALKLANNDFWEEYCFFSGNQGRRMIDVEFISQILIFFRFGIEEEIGQESINRAYKLYDESYSEYDEDKNMFLNLIDILKHIIIQSDEDKSVLRVLRRTTHLYTVLVFLYYVIYKYRKVNDCLVADLIRFIKAYDNDDYKLSVFEGQEDKLTLIDEYKETSKEGTKSKYGRMNRLKILKLFLNV